MLPLWQDHQGALDVGHLPSISAIPPDRAAEAADLPAFAFAHDPIIGVHPSPQGQGYDRALLGAVGCRCMSHPNRPIANREVRV